MKPYKELATKLATAWVSSSSEVPEEAVKFAHKAVHEAGLNDDGAKAALWVILLLLSESYDNAIEGQTTPEEQLHDILVKFGGMAEALSRKILGVVN